MAKVLSPIGSHCGTRQITPPVPMGSAPWRRLPKALTSPAPGEAVRLISRGWMTPS
jgi:hypothetical protein